MSTPSTCVCVCVSLCVYVCICVYMYARVRANARVYVCLRVHFCLLCPVTCRAGGLIPKETAVPSCPCSGRSFTVAPSTDSLCCFFKEKEQPENNKKLT